MRARHSKGHTEDYGTFKLDGDGRIALSQPCVGCGYELKGLDPEHDCPECGRPIVDSRRGRSGTDAWWELLRLMAASLILHALGFAAVDRFYWAIGVPAFLLGFVWLLLSIVLLYWAAAVYRRHRSPNAFVALMMAGLPWWFCGAVAIRGVFRF